MSTVNYTAGHAGEWLNRPPASADAWPTAGTARVDPGVEEYVKTFFPLNKKQTLARPQHLDAFYQGLQALPLRRPKAGDSAQEADRIEAANRKMVYDYVNKFDAGSGKQAYPKMVERALALKLSTDMLDKDISIGGPEKAALDRALKSAFATVSGLNAMSIDAFRLSMMLDPDGVYKVDDFE